MLGIAQERPETEDALALLRQADRYSAALYPVEARHPLSIADLLAASVQFFVARIDRRAVGCAALVVRAPDRGELKRMFVDAGMRGQGVGQALLGEIESTARREGIRMIQLETGPKSTAALHLYRRCGYAGCGPFGAYFANPHSVFMEKHLARI